MGYGGEYAGGVLAELAFENVVNFSDGKGWLEPLGVAVSGWLQHIGLAFEARAERISSTRDVRIAAALRPHAVARDLTDLGFGISQVLPVLICGLLQPEGSLFVVDLPEAHLHPRPQARLADFFCALAQSGRYSVVETHSDLFFHQLRLRVAENPSLRDSIAVYFIDEPHDESECAVPRRIELDAGGQLEWPTGFMHEGWELENGILQARRGQ
jgi:predicted ATPase